MARLRLSKFYSGVLRRTPLEVVKPASFRVRATYHPLHPGCDYVLFSRPTTNSPSPHLNLPSKRLPRRTNPRVKTKVSFRGVYPSDSPKAHLNRSP